MLDRDDGGLWMPDLLCPSWLRQASSDSSANGFEPGPEGLLGCHVHDSVCGGFCQDIDHAHAHSHYN